SQEKVEILERQLSKFFDEIEDITKPTVEETKPLLDKMEQEQTQQLQTTTESKLYDDPQSNIENFMNEIDPTEIAKKMEEEEKKLLESEEYIGIVKSKEWHKIDDAKNLMGNSYPEKLHDYFNLLIQHQYLLPELGIDIDG